MVMLMAASVLRFGFVAGVVKVSEMMRSLSRWRMK
jgi:hypothetical protein